MKNKKVPAPQTELLPPSSADGSPKPLVKLEIARPEPLLAGAQKLLTQAKAFKVDSAETYAQGADARQNIRAELDGMKARHKKMKAPIKEAEKEVDDLFRPAIVVLEDAMETITDSLTAYDAEQRRIADQKRREAEEKARLERAELERKAREERDRQAEAHRARERQEAAAREEQLRKERATAEAKAAEERLKREAAEAAAAGDKKRAEAAERQAVAERQKALEARKAQLRAEQDAERQRQEAQRQQQESQARATALEQQAAAVRAEEVKDETVEVEGLQRPKTWKWRLLDKSKVKPEYLILDEKTINRVVSSSKARAVEIIGPGIEVYEEHSLRQSR